MKPNTKLRKNTIIASVIGGISIALIIGVALLVLNTYRTNNTLNEEYYSYTSINDAARELALGSDILTSNVRLFAETGDVKYLNDYFREVNVDQHRDLAARKIEESCGDPEVVSRIREAMDYSCGLMDIEYHSMKLTCVAYRIDLDSVPAVVSEYPLNDIENRLGVAGMKSRASAILYNEEYALQKSKIDGAVDKAVAIASDRASSQYAQTNAEFEKNLRALFLLLVLLVVSITSFFILVIRISLHREKERSAMFEAQSSEAHANQSKAVFFSSLGHDISTPLSSILGFTSLARASISDKQKLQEYLEKIDIAGKNLYSLVSNTLDFSKLETGKFILDERICNVRDVLGKIYSSTYDEVSLKEQHLTIDMDIQHEWIRADMSILGRIVSNIVQFAVRFTQNGGTVNVNITENPSEDPGEGIYELEVKDNGIGFGEDDIRSMFSPSSDPGEDSDISIGMAVTKRMIDFLGGVIDVESEIGSGTTFTVSVRLPFAEQHDKASEKLNLSDMKFKGRKVLLVEDNDFNMEIACEVLSDNGFIVTKSFDGQEAVNEVMASDEPFFFILMDVQMPVMDGYEATRVIRALDDKAKASTPIIAMTASSLSKDREACLSSGMNECMSKPLNLKTLTAVLGRIGIL